MCTYFFIERKRWCTEMNLNGVSGLHFSPRHLDIACCSCLPERPQCCSQILLCDRPLMAFAGQPVSIDCDSGSTTEQSNRTTARLPSKPDSAGCTRWSHELNSKNWDSVPRPVCRDAQLELFHRLVHKAQHGEISLDSSRTKLVNKQDS